MKTHMSVSDLAPAVSSMDQLQSTKLKVNIRLFRCCLVGNKRDFARSRPFRPRIRNPSLDVPRLSRQKPVRCVGVIIPRRETRNAAGAASTRM